MEQVQELNEDLDRRRLLLQQVLRPGPHRLFRAAFQSKLAGGGLASLSGSKGRLDTSAVDARVQKECVREGVVVGGSTLVRMNECQ